MLNLQISPVYIEAKYMLSTPKQVHRPASLATFIFIYHGHLQVEKHAEVLKQWHQAEFLCTLFKYFEYHPENTDIVL